MLGPYYHTSIGVGVGFFQAVRTVGHPFAVNETANFPGTALQWTSNVALDYDYYTHSTSVNSHEIEVRQNGNYFVSMTLPVRWYSGDIRIATKAQLYVDGVAVNTGIGESSYIRKDSNHFESSANFAIVLPGLTAGQKISVVTSSGSFNGIDIVAINGLASLYVEFLPDARDYFYATATTNTGGTNFNPSSEEAINWVGSITGDTADFAHSNGTNPEQITLVRGGDYLVFINMPIRSTNQDRNSPLLYVEVDGNLVPGAMGRQGHIRNSSGHNQSSVHFVGLIPGAAAGDILRIMNVKSASADAGVVTLTPGGAASLFLERLDTSTVDGSNVYYSRSSGLVSGTNWNPATPVAMVWESASVLDSTAYEHTANTDFIRVKKAGDYLVLFNGLLHLSTTASAERAAPRFQINVNGSPVSGAESSSTYMRNLRDEHRESSGAIGYLLHGLSVDDEISVTVERTSDGNRAGDAVTNNFTTAFPQNDPNFYPGTITIIHKP